MRLSFLSSTLLPLLASLELGSSQLIISEVADKGTRNLDGGIAICSNTPSSYDGQDWVEIYNAGNESVDLSDYILHDNKGYLHDKVFKFSGASGQQDFVIEAGEYRVICPEFKIGGSDTVTLGTLSGIPVVDTTTQRQPQGPVVYGVTATVTLPNTDDAFDVTYSLDLTTNQYNYTSIPTPNAPNQFAPPEEAAQRWQDELKAINDKGNQFFNMDRNGYQVPDAMDAVVDLHVTMVEEDYEYMIQNASHELYRPFTSAALYKVNTTDNALWQKDTPGAKIRPRGQSTLYFTACMGIPTMPFLLDFGSQANSLFGVEKMYLRNKFVDSSYARDFTYNRMGARFGMPHLRARQVRFFVNNNLHGFYTLLESVDQEHVFARNFPNYNPASFALYKVKTGAIGCGYFDEASVDIAKERMQTDTATPPYNFERGEHRPPIPVLGNFTTCIEAFYGSIFQNAADSILAYLRYDESCPDMLIGEGLVDLDLGNKDFEKSMKELIPAIMAPPITSTDVTFALAEEASEKLLSLVDHDRNLRMLAMYAVIQNYDSPLGNGNNYYWVEPGDRTTKGASGWEIFPWDWDVAFPLTCNPEVCGGRLVHWSIARPTCASWDANPWAGPLLSDPDRFHQYIEYVREFVEIYGNETFIREIQDHFEATETAVRQDFWAFGGEMHDIQMSPDAATWDVQGMDEMMLPYPLLATITARADSVRQQLEAIDAGTFPRGPYGIGIDGVDYEDYETCPDWRAMEPDPIPTCPFDCMYEGCHTPGWSVESFCDPNAGVCYHGDLEEKCVGVVPGMGYEGMEQRNGMFTFCSHDNGPTKLSVCPPPKNSTEAGNETSLDEEDAETSDASSVVVGSFSFTLGLVATLFLFA